MICPSCCIPLTDTACPACGIHRALTAEQRRRYDRFLAEYAAIRQAEGRGSHDPAYYLGLPFRDATGKHSDQWAIRAATYRYFETHILPERPLDILDLGAGTGWLSYRLALRKHRPVAVDILTDPLDGLAAARHFPVGFPRFEAEFDSLPFDDGRFDMAIFNSSLHYSTDYRRTLGEAKRCLKPAGRIVVLDSPIYRRREHGEQMRAERHQQFETRYGFRSDSVPSLEYLYEAQLPELARSVGLRWRIHRPWYGWQWHLRPWKARLAGRRPPSRFWILVGSAA